MDQRVIDPYDKEAADLAGGRTIAFLKKAPS